MPTVSTELDLNAIAARARRYAELFTLPLKDRNWRGSAGEFAGSGAGSSLDFQDHRNYLPGDDPRHINWQAYARTGNYSLKLYREEVRPVVEIIFDVSDSMFADPDKATRALELFYFAVASGEKSGAATHVYLTKGPRWKALEPGAVYSHHWEQVGTEMSATESSASPNLMAIPLRARSLRVFISDLLFLSEPEPTMQALLHHSGRGIILCPFTRDESSPSWEGNYEFIDTESRARHDRRIDRTVLRHYIEAYRRHFAQWKAAAIRAQSPLARIPSEATFEAALKLEAVPSGALNLV